MSDKYISHGNTYDGDGTSPNPATSNGGVGAWNDLKAIMSAAPTYGSLNAGDVVYIRTKNGSDITVDFGSSNLTCYNVGTVTDPVTWIADDGTKWSGDNGTLTIQFNGNSADLKMGYYAIYKGVNLNWVFENTGGTGHQIDWLQFRFSFVINIKFTYQTQSTNIGQVIGNNSRFLDCYFDVKRGYTSPGNTYATLNTGIQGAPLYVTNCVFDCSTYPENVDNYQLANRGSYGDFSVVFGSKEVNGGVEKKFFTPRTAIYNNGYVHNRACRGLDYGVSVKDRYIIDHEGLTHTTYSIEDMNGVPFDFIKEDGAGSRSWQRGLNVPTLNAVLPGNISWSIKVIPGIDISRSNPMLVYKMNKLYNKTAAKNKITLELVIKDTSNTDHCFDNPKKQDWFIVVSYVDNTTGDIITEISDIDDTDLEVSNTSWVPMISGDVVYGPNTYARYKVSLSTSNNIKENTIVNMVVFTTRGRISIEDYNFIDPDFTMEVI